MCYGESPQERFDRQQRNRHLDNRSFRSYDEEMEYRRGRVNAGDPCGNYAWEKTLERTGSGY